MIIYNRPVKEGKIGGLNIMFLNALISFLILLFTVMFFFMLGFEGYFLDSFLILIPIILLVIWLVKRYKKFSNKQLLVKEKGYDGHAKFIRKKLEDHSLLYATRRSGSGFYALLSFLFPPRRPPENSYTVTYSYTDEKGVEHEVYFAGIGEETVLALEQYGDIPIKFIGKHSNLCIDPNVFLNTITKAREAANLRKSKEP